MCCSPKGDFLMPKIKRSRDFAFVLYPDSVNPNWERLLADLQQPVFWILHDKDVVLDRSTGELVPKKPHYHVQVIFDNPRSTDSILKLIARCGGNGYLEDLVSRRGYARYLTHLDDLEKHQYSQTEVHELCGADYSEVIKTKSKAKTDEINMIKEIILFVNSNHIHIYADLIDYCVKVRPEWLKLLVSYNGRMIRDYIKSIAYACREENERLNRFKV